MKSKHSHFQIHINQGSLEHCKLNDKDNHNIMNGLECITFSMNDTTSQNAWDLGPSSRKRRASNELMMSSSTRILASLPKSTTTKSKVRHSSIIDKWKDSHLIPLLEGGLGCDTSSKNVEVTSSYTLIFLSLPFIVISLAFSSCFFFSTSFKQLFSKASLTFFAFSLSYAMSLSRALSFMLHLSTLPY